MNILMLASSSQNQLSNWKSGLGGFVSTMLKIDNFLTNELEDLRLEVANVKPQTLLLDLDLLSLDGTHGFASLRQLCSETQVVIMSDEISEDLEWLLLKVGVRGCCLKNMAPNNIEQVVNAVQQGQLWIRRTLTSRFINELSREFSKFKTHKSSLGLISKLTHREYDIALRVADGENNKQIAQACDITERTVKAHLTEIFHKLAVNDRLNLALVLIEENRIRFEKDDASVSLISQIQGEKQSGNILKKFYLTEPVQIGKFLHQ